MKGLVDEANESKLTISQLTINNEVELQGITEEDMMTQMAEQFDVMVKAVRKGTQELTMAKTGVAGGDGYRVFQYAQKKQSLVDPFTLEVVANAMAVNEVNASMGRIVATPTAGSAGILPAVLTHMYDTNKFSREEIVRVMFTASALGLVIANRASISGAQGSPLRPSFAGAEFHGSQVPKKLVQSCLFDSQDLRGEDWVVDLDKPDRLR